MPQGAEILCIQTQDEIPCVWVLVDPNRKLTKVTFEIFGTGQNIPELLPRKYIGTYQLKAGELVFHCFKVITP